MIRSPVQFRPLAPLAEVKIPVNGCWRASGNRGLQSLQLIVIDWSEGLGVNGIDGR